MKTIKEVRKHFKNAEEIKTYHRIIRPTKKELNNIYKDSKDTFWCSTSEWSGIVWDAKNGYAEIITYKKKNKYKKFIKDAYKGKLGLTMCDEWKERIEKDFPKLVEKKDLFDIWLKDDEKPNWIAKYDTKNNTMYGLDGDGEWFSYTLTTENPNKIKANRPATEEEVSTALINEAKKKYIGKKVENGLYGTRHLEFPIKSIKYIDDCIVTDSECIIFHIGKWAEIITPPKEIQHEGHTYILKD